MGSNDLPAEREWLPFLKLAIENANDAVIVCDYDPASPSSYLMRYVNPMFERQTGYSLEEAIGQPPDLLYGPLTDRAVVERAKQSLLAGLPIRVELRKYRKDGTTFWSEVNMRPLSSEAAELSGYVGIQRDIDERVKALAKLELLSSAIDQASDAMAMFEWRESTGSWGLAYVNEMFLRLTGYRRDDVIGRSSDFLVGPQTDAHTLNAYRVALLAGEPVRGEIAFYRADGTPFWAELSARPLKDASGRVVNSIIVYRDVTEQHFRDQRLSYEATHDPLTGANNRRSFVTILDAAIHEARRHDAVHGLLFFDLDGFKPINDRYGHEAGDRMLVDLTAAVTSKLRRGDLLGRMGGDEFAVLLRECPPEQAERIANDLLNAIGGLTLLWGGHALRIGASIGVVCVDASIADSAEALRRVDEVCYAAKRAGRNCIVVAGRSASA